MGGEWGVCAFVGVALAPLTHLVNGRWRGALHMPLYYTAPTHPLPIYSYHCCGSPEKIGSADGEGVKEERRGKTRWGAAWGGEYCVESPFTH